jgi:hypothetical protein
MMEGKLERSEMTKRTTKKTMAAAMLGRLGGRAGTSKQNEARKRNAQRAGRPGRVCIACNEPVVGGHVDRRLDATCGAHGWRWQRRDDPHVPPVANATDSRERTALLAIGAVLDDPTFFADAPTPTLLASRLRLRSTLRALLTQGGV